MKDPAFLFYPESFLTGTMLMSDEQVGKYIRLLCLQHQQGHLPEEDMLSVCKSYDNRIFSKFVNDEHGLYFNERLEIEVNKRKTYIQSRSNNKKGKTKSHENHMKITSESHENHSRDINTNGDISLNKKNKYADYVSMTEGEYKALVKRVGESGAKRCVEILDNYKGANGKKYDSDYRAILNWVVDRWKEESAKASPKIGSSDYDYTKGATIL